MAFFCNFDEMKRPCLFGGTKAWSPGIGMVLHWQSPDVHIFNTDPSIFKTHDCINIPVITTLIVFIKYQQIIQNLTIHTTKQQYDM